MPELIESDEMRKTFARAVSSVLSVVGVACLATACAGPGPVVTSHAVRPYIFTNVHDADLLALQGVTEPQTVRLGVPVQIQLPAIPTVWTLEDSGGAELTLIERRFISNPGRFLEPCRIAREADPSLRCPQSIFELTLATVEAGDVEVRLSGTPASSIPPGQHFTLKLTVVP